MSSPELPGLTLPSRSCGTVWVPGQSWLQPRARWGWQDKRPNREGSLQSPSVPGHGLQLPGRAVTAIRHSGSRWPSDMVAPVERSASGREGLGWPVDDLEGRGDAWLDQMWCPGTKHWGGSRPHTKWVLRGWVNECEVLQCSHNRYKKPTLGTEGAQGSPLKLPF